MHLVLLSLLLSAPAQGDQGTSQCLYGEGVPETGFLTAKTTNYQVLFSASAAWTLQEIHFRGQLVGGPTGFYGTVVVPAGGNWIGTGHTEGGREIVHALQLRVDGQERPVQIGDVVEGHIIELVKTSTIHKFAAIHTITVTDDEIVEHARLRATEPHELKRMYLFMHCWPKEADTWIAQSLEGEILQGGFRSDGGHPIDKVVRWAAEHLPGTNLSLLCYMPRPVVSPTAKTFIWDHERYHKLYVQHNSGAALAAEDELDYTMVVKVVPGETGDWAATRPAVADLERRYPPVEE